MVFRILVLFLGGYWFISAGVAAWIGRQKGRMIEGLGLGILMGPIGPILVALLPDLRKAAAHEAHHVRHDTEAGAHAIGEHEVGHVAHAPEVEEHYAPSHEHERHEGAGAHEAREDRKVVRPVYPEQWVDDEEGWEDVAPPTQKRMRIDWLWLIFYGGWSLFVVFCWLWLLMYS